MQIDCHCDACGLRFKAAEKYAGRRVKCPACSAGLLVPESGAKPAPATEPKKPPRRRTKPALMRAKPLEPPEPTGGGGFPAIDTGQSAPASPASPASESRQPAVKRSNRTLLIVGGSAAAAIVCLIAVVAGVSMLGEAPSTSPTLLILDWPEDERADAGVMIDRRKMELPKKGPVRYEITPGKHHLVLMRRGHAHIRTRLTLAAGESHHFTPQWETVDSVADVPDGWPTPKLGSGSGESSGSPDAVVDSYADWFQDIEKAKLKAKARHRDILVLFDGSDWNEAAWDMSREVFLHPEFRDQADWRFVFVHIDFPNTAKAKAAVEDAQRNAELAKRFHVNKYPTVVLTDAEGRPYGREGYREGGLEAFMERISYWQAAREQRDTLFSAVEAARGEAKVDAILEALTLLERMRVSQFYEPIAKKWALEASRFDPNNERGLMEAFFAVLWLSKLFAVDEKDSGQLDKLIAELEAWEKSNRFKSPDRGALLHLYAARVLASAERMDAAEQHINRGLAHKPTDLAIRAQLTLGQAAIRGVGVGTGFVVTPDGHLLTNHHVIKDAEKLGVRLPGGKKPIPVRIVAKDPQGDMALLKADLPKGVKIEPAPISTADMHRGARVGAFGYPLGETVGFGLKLTTGIVSATPEQSNDNMMLLDCRVNPGNSGGPLCDGRGNVVGMVTAKSYSSESVDSYGMALPGGKLLAFLKKHLPNYRPPPLAETTLEWDAIDSRVGPGVLMIVRGM